MKNHLKKFREQFNLTQEQLADLVGVSRQTIISIERGRYNPSLLLAHKLAETFNCQIETLFIFTESEEGGD